MSQEDYARYPDELRMREIKVRKKVLACRAGLGKYQATLGMEALSCKTAAMCEKEMWFIF